MAKYSSFEEMQVYQKALLFGVKVYKLTNTNPAIAKDYGLKDQLQRAALSISNNIAEGFDRRSDADFSRFLYMALGSASEVRSMIHLAERLKYINIEVKDDLFSKGDEVSKIIRGLIKSLKPK